MNQRKSFRCKVFGPAAAAELQLGQLRMDCRLLDESAGGFAAVVSSAEELTTGAVGCLSHKGGRFEVRVVHAIRLKPAPETLAQHPSAAHDHNTGRPAVAEASAAQPEGAPALWRLGLERLGEVAPPAPSPINWRVLASLIPLPRLMVRNIPLFIGGITIAVVIIAGPLFLVLHWPKKLPWTNSSRDAAAEYKPARGPSLFSPAGTHPDLPPNHAPPESRLPLAQLAAQVARATGDRAEQTLPSAVGPTRGEDPADIGKLLARLPGATPFELPQVADKLGLTAQQRVQIKRIVNDCARMIEVLEQQAAGASRQQIARYRQAVLDEARAEALRVLSAEQRAQCEQLAKLAKLAKAPQSDKQPEPSADGAATSRAGNQQ